MNNFPRPIRKGTRPPQAEAPTAPPEVVSWKHPWPRMDATLAALAGLGATGFVLMNSSNLHGSHLAHTTAVGVLAAFVFSLLFEARGGLQNLARPDLVGILALYYLTLYEFLFPQPYFDRDISDIHAVYLALWAVIIGFISLFVGRHFISRGEQPFADVMTKHVPPRWLLTIFWVSFFIGFLDILLATDFSISKIIEAMMDVRFSQPWGRGKLGDWKALIHELSLLLYLVPPIFGLMLGKRERYSPVNLLLAGVAFLWLLFFGFAAGMRTVFAAYLVTFLIAFTFSAPPQRRRQVIAVAVICGGMMMMATKVMLEMRTVGLKRWWNGDVPSGVTRHNSSVFVDNNLYAIARLAQYFPELNGGRYLGFEIPYLALIRPIPRAIWPGKPIGLSVSIEQVFRVKGMTIAATFIGEAYMSGGFFAVALSGIILGILATFWNRFASPKNSELGLLVYSSGFFAVTITMRSCFAFTTALLPCLAGILFGKYLLPKIREKFKPRPVVPPQLRGNPGNPPPIS